MKQKRSEEKREGLLWDASKKYTKGEINAKQLKNTLSSHSRGSDDTTISEAIRYFLTISTIIINVMSIILYVITRNTLILTITLLSTVPILTSYRYYFVKKDKDKD